MKRAHQLDVQLLLSNDLTLLNQGALVEQFVGQELLAYSPSYEKTKLYFWARDGSGAAEVDYIVTKRLTIYPIEVKSGKLGKLRSLQQYMREHQCKYSVRISPLPLSYEKQVLSVPLYMVSELTRLL